MGDEIKTVVDRVRRDWVIRRLRAYPKQMEAIRMIRVTYANLIREIDGVKSPVLSDMPHGLDRSDRTYTQAARLPRLWARIDELEQEVEAIKADLQKLDEALLHLNPTERFVIDSRYLRPVSQKQYRVLARTKGYAESTLMNAHTSAIKKLVQIL